MCTFSTPLLPALGGTVVGFLFLLFLSLSSVLEAHHVAEAVDGSAGLFTINCMQRLPSDLSRVIIMGSYLGRK